jgi:hypothetical protein
MQVDLLVYSAHHRCMSLVCWPPPTYKVLYVEVYRWLMSVCCCSHRLVFKEHYMEISTSLAASTSLFGLGETLKLAVATHVYTCT